MWFDVTHRGVRYRMPVNDLAVPRMEPGKQRPIESLEEARDWQRLFIGEIKAGRDPRAKPTVNRVEAVSGQGTRPPGHSDENKRVASSQVGYVAEIDRTTAEVGLNLAAEFTKQPIRSKESQRGVSVPARGRVQQRHVPGTRWPCGCLSSPTKSKAPGELGPGRPRMARQRSDRAWGVPQQRGSPHRAEHP